MDARVKPAHDEGGPAAKSLRFRDRGGSSGLEVPARVLMAEQSMSQAPDTAEANPAESAPLHPPEATAIAAADAPAPAPAPLLKTPLHALHVARGARMVPFAGYEMPLQYADGIIAEHHHVRAETGLFDASHMGQAF